jgi:serine/threonine protein kinase/WD40 repeat protein/tetratricopeptide (TPR) repeat protein
MPETHSGPDLLDEPAQDFVQRYRAGERPALTEYTDRYPELADQIRDLFPALVVIEEFGSVAGQPVAGAPADRRVPRQLGEYRILREVGRGGMGVVYEAVQESLGRHVALKVLPLQGLVSTTHRERFEREARAVARLHHTNIVPVFGSGAHAGIHYYAMQFIQGQGLDAVLDEVRRLRGGGAPAAGQPLTVSLAHGLLTTPVDAPDAVAHSAPTVAQDTPSPAGSPTAPPGPALGSDHPSDLAGPSEVHYFRGVARLGVQVAEALAYAHRQGIVHRDIKPSNLLLDTQGVVWVTDFGLVKDERGDSLTRTGDFVGTVRFMAPERFDGQGDGRSDIYSLGATLYELLALRPAFEDANRARLVERVQHEEPVRPRKLDPRIPRDLETVVLKAMAKDLAVRYQAAGELAADLRRFLADRPVRARAASVAERFRRWCRRNPVIAALLAAVATLLLTIAVVSSVMWWHLNRAHQDAVAKGRALQDELAQSRLSQARFGRLSRQLGRRFDGLKALAEAARLAEELDLPQERILELRNEAIACLALTDLRPARRLEDLAPANLGNGLHPQVAFDRRWEVYARGDPEGNVSVRRLADDQELARFSRPLQVAALLLFSPDGQYLVAKYFLQHSEKPVEYLAWDWRTGRELVRQFCEPDSSPGIDFAFTGDGRQLLLGGRSDGALGIYDVASGRQARRLELGGALQCLALHPGSRRLAVVRRVAGESRDVTVRSLDTGAVLNSFTAGANLSDLAWDPDGNRLAAAAESRHVYLWETSTGRLGGILGGHESAVARLTFNHVGTLLAAAARDGTTCLWEPVTGRLLVRATGLCLAFNPDGQSLAYRSGEEVGVWEVAHERVCRTMRGHWGGGLGQVDFSPDGRLLASAANDGVRLWDADAARPLGELPLGRTATALFHPGGDSLFTSGNWGLSRFPLRYTDGEGGRVLRVGPPQSLPVPVSQRLESASCDGRGLRLGVVDLGDKGIIVNLDDPTRQTLLVGHERVNVLALSPNGRWAATGTVKGGEVKLWDLSLGDRPMPVHTISSDWARPFFSPDGRWLVIADSNRNRWYRVGSWELEREGGTGGGVLAFAADTRLMAEYSAVGRRVVLSDPETGRERGALTVEDGPLVVALALSPDGGRLAAATGAQTLQLWDLRALRRQLTELGLDWDPSHRLAEPEPGPPLRFTLDVDRDFARRAETSAVRFQLEQRLEHLDSQLQGPVARSGEATLWSRRGLLRARLARWKPAAADLAQAVRLDPGDQNSCYHLAGVLLWLGERDGYRQRCEEMLRRFGRTTDPLVAERTAKVCLIVPGTVAEKEQAVRLTEQALNGPETQQNNPWFLQSRGLAECRAGRPRQALDWVQGGRQRFKDAPPVYTALSQLILSLAHHQLKEADRARRALSEAVRIIDNELPRESSGDLGDGWLDWVFCQVMRREAEEGLNGR